MRRRSTTASGAGLSRRGVLRAALGVTALLCLAIGSPGCTPPEPPTRVELGLRGSTEYAFVPIPDEGSEIELIAGPQGGYHLDVALRIWIETPVDLVAVYAVRDTATGAVFSAEGRFPVPAWQMAVVGDHYVAATQRAVLDVNASDQVIGREVDVTVRVSVRGGAEFVEHSRRVTVIARP